MKSKSLVLMLAFALTFMTGCVKKSSVNLGGQMDRFEVSDEDGSKVYLGNAEKWLYWETDDTINVYGGSGSGSDDSANCWLVSGQGTLEAFFHCEKNIPEGDIHAFYPHTLAPSRSGSTWTLHLPRCQKYREDNSATGQDSSFGRGAMPMVAYDATSMANTGNIFFHVVAGILRVQLYSTASDAFTIDSLIFEDKTQRLSGDFTLTEAAIQDNAPFITPAASPTAEQRKVSISNINQVIGGTTGKLWTFYLPLPSTKDMNDPAVFPKTDHYNLKMTVIGKQNGVRKQAIKYIAVDIHRRNLTMTQALNLTDFATIGNGSGTATPTIVGCGTKDRPFQIYTVEELQYIANCMNAGQSINGQTIRGTDNTSEGPTYFKVVRSDITLGSDWTPFSNFKGYMYFSSSTATEGGVTNNSGKPIFDTISANGRVERLYVKGTQNFTPTGTVYSPFCNRNRGYIVDCHNQCAVTIPPAGTGHHLAGLCVVNYGYIIGGANEASLETPGNVGGICYNNYGSIQGNFSMSSAVPKGTNIAGICYNNSGNVYDCQVSANASAINSTGNWGIIVFTNQSSGVVDNCNATGTVVFTTTGSIGGICNTNYGTVGNSSLNIQLRGASGALGGIVAVLEGGEVFNCKSEGDHYVYGYVEPLQATYAGGIVGQANGGTVYNCYNNSRVQGALMSGGVVGSINSGVDIQNCWTSYGDNFQGDHNASRDDRGIAGPFCFSANASDTTANEGCCLMLKDGSGVVTTIVVPYSMRTGSPMSSYYNTPTPLVDVLNDWVTAHGGTSGKYTSWTQGTYDPFPRFASGTKSKSKYRRPPARRR